ncbi:dTDP-4-dehydrorhamnose reductase [Maribacter cobaltidurans]|uniref:dTDP-4-dehydrorhamnose reductase n=1 Tax=Maribacter cobaltidurans TaxID=1178778 RepID=A0A223V3R9_9FLAO|nr:dTDP-4-dehydrorhamnose reductase [Maribacter cobaltidurans]ASV29638.1 dTDP-4-dehydrorhamnose reductase [Maribacter cobaltidurans]GGD67180.1 NAD(P)-dependent oxidoreductase [Maribacter cobaltidurans]
MQKIKKVLVTGASGQLGTTIKSMRHRVEGSLQFEFTDSDDLDITSLESVKEFFGQKGFDYCINCAAYTQVDKAEEDSETALKINEEGVKNLAQVCHQSNTILLHVSTDFVFDGRKNVPYLETDRANPVSVYGHSKFKGEQQIVRNMDRYFIIRTSWLYSAHGHNFFKSMLKYGKERKELSVVFDQVGTPTSAHDLVEVLIMMITNEVDNYGIYHYSNEGVASWYDFASAIFEINDIAVDLKPIRSKDYPLPAERPAYSVMDKHKIKKVLDLTIPHWRKSLVEVSQIFKKESK